VIVSDTNVLAYLLVTSERSAAARKLRRVDREWAAPPVWRSELRNVLVKHMRQGTLTRDAAILVMEQAEQVLRRREYHVTSADVLKLAARSRCSAYDCEFVALAQQLRVPLVTADRQLLAEFPSIAMSLEARTAQ